MKKLSNYEEICKNIPIETKIRVTTEMDFISLLTELGYREDKSWGDDEDEILSKLCKLAQEHTNEILKLINEENNKTKTIKHN